MYMKVLDRIKERFPLEDHRSDERGFTYIEIVTMLNALDAATDGRWNLRIKESSLLPLPGETYGKNKLPAYLSKCVVSVDIWNEDDEGFFGVISRDGIGADRGSDVDKIVKTAQANATKKALNQLGMARYLWDEATRDELELAQRIQRGDVAALKLAVRELAPYGSTVEEVAEFFKVNVEDLSSREILLGLLEEHGKVWA